MKVNVVQIGNSRGIRIPKAILEQCRIDDRVDLAVHDGKITLEASSKAPRAGWAEAFQRLAADGEDELLMGERLDANFDADDWQW